MRFQAPRAVRKALLAIAALALASVAATGCTNIVVNGIVVAKGNLLSVRDSTEISVTATTTRPFATLTFQANARRGRIVQRSESDPVFTYYAPFTSRFPDQSGNLTTGDTIQIRVSDGSQTVETNQTIQLSGSSIVFKGAGTGCREGGNFDCNGPLYIATVDDSGLAVRDVKPLKDDRGCALVGTQPAVSPDGRKIAWVLWPTTGASCVSNRDSATHVWTLDAGGVKTQITTVGYNLDPSWSPLGNELAFASDRNEARSYDIYTVSTDQQNLPARRVTSNGVDERYPAWNPTFQNRTKFAVSVHASSITNFPASNNAFDPWNVIILNAQTGQYERQVTSLSQQGDFALEPRWRADGQWLAFTYNGPICGSNPQQTRFQRIFYQDANSQGLAKLLTAADPGGGDTAESNPAWSPGGGGGGGNEIAFLRYKMDTSGVPLQPIQVFKGRPDFSKTDACTPATSMLQQWQLSGPEAPDALHIASTYMRPVGGVALDWR